MNVGFVAMTHLGVNYSAASAANRFSTLCYDPDPALIERLERVELPVEEPGLVALIRENQPRLTYTSTVEDLAVCDLVFFSLDIKTTEENLSDTGPLLEILRATIPKLRDDAVVVILSQVQPGFTRAFIEELKKSGASGNRRIYYQVETLIFGRAVERATKPERYIIGSDDPARPLPACYEEWLKTFHCPLLLMKYESAELAKISINFYLVSSVTTSNTLAEICERMGAEWSEIIPALRLDARIGPQAYLKPGLGIAGGNLERDLMTVKGISARHGTDVGVVDAWIHNSAYRKAWPRRTLSEIFCDKLDGVSLAVWGLAYKENTHSIKNSPSIEFLKSVPTTKIKAFDPQVKTISLPHVTVAESEIDACEGAEALLILTPWPQFSKANLKAAAAKMKGDLVLDPYGITSRELWRSFGFRHLQLGSFI